jgi:hypothetical protein
MVLLLLAMFSAPECAWEHGQGSICREKFLRRYFFLYMGLATYFEVA